MMPPVVAGMMWLVILDPSLGAANYILTSLGLPPSDWLASPTWVIPTVALIDTWQWTPYVALIVLGGLQSLPSSVYEAAQIDGASALKTFLAFVFSWNYFLFALVLSNGDTKTLIAAAFNFVGEGSTQWGVLMAAATLIALPPLILAALVQRWLVSGLTLGAVKG